MREVYDLVVIGAGPAGMAAATEASARGVATLVLDEQAAPGGQIYRGIDASPLLRRGMLGPDYAHGATLAEAFRESAAEYRPATTVWDITRDRWIGIKTHDECRFVRAERIVVATGAMERPFPIPGWTLPGVMTVGAAQILLKTSGATPGPQTVLAGTGPLLYLFARQLLHMGVRVQAVLDTTPTTNYFKSLPFMAQAWRSRDILKKGLRILADLHAARINWITRVTDVRIDGDEHVYALTYRRGAEEVRLETDLVLLHQGVVPNIQLSRAIGCEHVWSEPQLCWVPKTDAWGQTTMEGVLIAGDGGGIDGAAAAEQAGRLAALQVACALGRIDESTRDRAAVPLRKALMHQWRARPFLNALYRPEDHFRVPAREDVIACRCEDVSVGAVRAAARLGCAGPNQLKAFTRAGMGPCQGRMCGLTVYETLAHARGVSPAAIGSYRLRPPIKPVSLGAIAAMRVPGEDPDLDFNEALEVQNPEVSQFGDVPKWS